MFTNLHPVENNGLFVFVNFIFLSNIFVVPLSYNSVNVNDADVCLNIKLMVVSVMRCTLYDKCLVH